MNDLIVLAVTIGGRWRPGIGDPTILGWVTVVAYFFAAVVCGRVCWIEYRVDRSMNRVASPAFWLVLALLLAFLGVNKQLDLQSLLTDIGRRLALQQGWYGQRREVQFVFIITVGAVSWLAFGGVAWLGRKDMKRRATALFGVVMLIAFVMIRASSFHHVDAFINTTLAGVRCNAIMELGGIGLTALGAFVAMRPRAGRRRGRGHAAGA